MSAISSPQSIEKTHQLQQTGPIKEFTTLLDSLIGAVYNKAEFQKLKSLYNSLPPDLKTKFITHKSKDNNTILHFAALVKDSGFIHESLSQLPQFERKKCILSSNGYVTPFNIATSSYQDKRDIGNAMLRTLSPYEISEIESSPKNYGWNLDDVNSGVYDYAPPLLECPKEYKC
ncbi:MAG: hypothetical protein K940chlam5_01751 [Candidatus Anoxychlamydiales bacterium]|nr:hypothetical protein [Candidatus Anoxychlamydiales bacterium]